MLYKYLILDIHICSKIDEVLSDFQVIFHDAV